MKDSTSKVENGFLKGAASLSLAALLVKVLGVAYKIPLSHILGDDGMGYFNTAYTVYMFFFMICTAGVPKAITLLVSESVAKGRGQEFDILKTARRVFLIIGFVLFLLFTTCALPISDFIGSKKSAYAMLAIAPSIPLIAASAVYRGYLNGKMRFGAVAVSQFIEAGMKLIIGLIFANIAMRAGASTDFIAAAAIFGITVGSLVTLLHLIAVTNNCKSEYISRQNSKSCRELVQKILRISLPITVSSGVISLVNVIDLTVVMRGLEQNGYAENISTMIYGNYTTLAIPMFNFALSIISSVCISLLPVLSELAAKKKEEKFVETLTDASGIVAFFALPATVAFAAFSNEILIILFDQGSVALGGAMLSLLSPSVALIALLTVINTSLEAKGGYTVPLISMSVGGVVKLLASSFFVGKTDLAIWGAPLGTAISYSVSILVSILIFRKSGGRIVGLLREFLLSTFCAVIAALPVILIKDRVLLSERSPIQSLALLFIYAFLYLLLSFLCGTISIRRLKNMAK